MPEGRLFWKHFPKLFILPLSQNPVIPIQMFVVLAMDRAGHQTSSVQHPKNTPIQKQDTP